MKLWVLICILAALCGVGLVLSFSSRAHAQVPGTVQADGSVAGVPTIAPGAEADTVVKVLVELKAAASEKRWGAFVSILLSALLAFANWLLIRSKEAREKVRDFMPEIAIGMALLGYVAIALAALPAGAHVGDWWAVILPALKTGAAAVGLYAFVVKRCLGFYVPKIAAGVRALLVRWGVLKPPAAPIDADKTPTGSAT